MQVYRPLSPETVSEICSCDLTLLSPVVEFSKVWLSIILYRPPLTMDVDPFLHNMTGSGREFPVHDSVTGFVSFTKSLVCAATTVGLTGQKGKTKIKLEPINISKACAVKNWTTFEGVYFNNGMEQIKKIDMYKQCCQEKKGELFTRQPKRHCRRHA